MKKDNTTISKSDLLSKWRNRNKGSSKSEAVQPRPKGAVQHVSREQMRLWFLQQLYPNNPFYNYSELYKLEGALDPEAFKKSIICIEQQHEILRANFIVEEGSPIIAINSKTQATFHFHDYSHLPLTDAKTKADALIKTNAKYVFNLSNETLMQTTLIKVAEKQFLFLIVMHHIITDKWSMKVFRKELASYYSEFIKGNTPEIKKPEIQYLDYAFWQKNQSINNTHLEYWKHKLSGDIPVLNLPNDYPKKAQPSYKGTFHKQKYDTTLSTKFFQLCKTLGATPYVTMLSAYYVLLHKYSHQNDILVGTPITKRDNVDLENLIGFFNDTLVLRSQIDANATFKALVETVKQTTLDAFTHKDISFDTLVKALKPKRALNIHPFFQVMFLYHKVPETPSFGENIKLSYEPYDAGVAKFDITLYISEDKGELMSLLEYETDLFDGTTIARMHAHFHNILHTVVNTPEIVIEDIKLQTKEEASFYELVEQEPQPFNIPFNGIHELIIKVAEEYPNHTAVVYNTTSLTYAELNEKSDLLAYYLIQNGVKKNDIVAFAIERSIDMVVTLLGILKSGAAYLPLDPNYPANRISYILENANSKILITQKHIASQFEKLLQRTVTINTIYEDKSIEHCKLPTVDGLDLAYVIYTSGSTGFPKGVPISHANIINSTLARNDFYPEAPKAFLLLSSISFDSSKAGVFWSLCTGGALVIAEKHLEQDIYKLSETIKQNKITHTLLLPSLYSNIIQYAEPETLKTLTTVIVAGEACSNTLVSMHFSSLPQINLYNEYGPTESTVWCIAHKITEEDASKNSVPIGKPIRNIQIYILNDNLQKVPFGTPGELFIGGLGLSKGYLNDAEKTANAFIENPFALNQDERLYKTGDLAKFKTDGTIEFLGRKDQQVKIRGYRIELDEIEQQLRNSKGVKQAVITLEENKANINWEKLLKEDIEEFTKALYHNFTDIEINELVTNLGDLQDEAIDIVLENLN